MVPNGRFASTRCVTAGNRDRDDLHITSIMANPASATLERLADAVADGTIRAPITRTHQLRDVPQALADFTAGNTWQAGVRVATANAQRPEPQW